MICTRDPKRLRSAAAHSTRVLSPTVTLETPCPARSSATRIRSPDQLRIDALTCAVERNPMTILIQGSVRVQPAQRERAEAAALRMSTASEAEPGM